MRDKEILLIDKPKSISSFEVIRILRKKLKVKKIGHSGTLDPLASGLLIIGVGKGTKKLKDFLKLPKVYLTEILLGRETETGDQDGKVLVEKEIEDLPVEKVKKVLTEIKGKHCLPVPKYSAIKRKGVPLYKLARKGIDFQPPKKMMEVYSIKFLSLTKKDRFFLLKVEIFCSSGTYIRSLAEEIGRRLSLPASLFNLRRTKIGKFKIEEAKKLEDF
ncbi:tRNA pseudouridine(55) synthase TruB [bacterium]|nr:tRNA pseudouridine(55) synthase TruB [bacterium]